MKTTIHLSTKQTSLELQRIASKDIPYALAQGLNGVAKAARDQIKQELPSIFHNTNAFTRNAVAFTPATKNYQTATIFIKDQQAYNDLLFGNKPISVSYSQETGAKSVTYTQANLQQLQGYILELQRTLGINRRRATGIRFR